MPKNLNISELLEEYNELLEQLDNLRTDGDNDDMLSCLEDIHEISEPLVEKLR